MRAWVLVLVLVIPLVSTQRARAQDADALIEEGISLREQGRDEEALARFERAQAAQPSPRALAQIALAEQALGRFASAEAHLDAALADAEDRFVRRNRALLEQALVEIRAQVGELAITGGAEGATVAIDGAPRGALPLAAPLRLDHGTHRVEVRADGFRPFASEVEIAAGARAELDVALEPIPTAARVEPEVVTEPSPVREPERGVGWMMPTGIALAGAGAIGLGVGIGLAVVREDHAQARLTCSDTDPACRDRYQAALDAEAGAIASFVVGGLLAAGGATLLVLSILDGPSGDERALSCAPGVLAVGCRARF